jgi:hypothetical protein
VTLGGVEYGFKTTSLSAKAREIDRSNSKYQSGFEITKPGSLKLTFTASGPYREGETPIQIGAEYAFVYKIFAAHVGFPFLGGVIDITYDNDVTDGPTMSISVTNTDEFEVEFS